MTDRGWFGRTLVASLILSFAFVTRTGSAQQPPQGPVLPDGPQVLNSSTGRIRVVPIKGLVYPWALAFLPNGDMLVTEQSRTTLRIIRKGVLDPTPITGLPTGITSTRRDTAGVDLALHPWFGDKRLVHSRFW